MVHLFFRLGTTQGYFLFGSLTCVFYNLDNWSESKRFVRSKFRKYLGQVIEWKSLRFGPGWSMVKSILFKETYLSVKLDPWVFVRSHELRIPPRILSNTCLDPLDPKFRPLTSFASTVTISVLPRFLQASDCHPKAVFGTTSKPNIKFCKATESSPLWEMRHRHEKVNDEKRIAVFASPYPFVCLSKFLCWQKELKREGKRNV